MTDDEILASLSPHALHTLRNVWDGAPEATKFIEESKWRALRSQLHRLVEAVEPFLEIPPGCLRHVRLTELGRRLHPAVRELTEATRALECPPWVNLNLIIYPDVDDVDFKITQILGRYGG